MLRPVLPAKTAAVESLDPPARDLRARAELMLGRCLQQEGSDAHARPLFERAARGADSPEARLAQRHLDRFGK